MGILEIMNELTLVQITKTKLPNPPAPAEETHQSPKIACINSRLLIRVPLTSHWRTMHCKLADWPAPFGQSNHNRLPPKQI